MSAGEVPGSRTATSASRTYGSPASASECTATVSMPRRRQVRKTRDAISGPVGDEESLCDHVRNTPYPSAPRIGAFSMTDRQIASTVRVSRGSMTPSS